MRTAVVAGGWHWPGHFFYELPKALPGADLFVVAHRSPELSVVVEEKLDILQKAQGPLADLDREMYRWTPNIHGLTSMGWEYEEAPNICGDWCFFNQWLEGHDYKNYDVILNCHDDTYIRRHDLWKQLDGDWLLLANGMVGTADAPEAYVRGSFEFWKSSLLDMLGGRIDLGEVKLTREGKSDTPASRDELQPWNDTCAPLRTFMVEHDLTGRIASLSPHYRISPWAIEGERGYIHKQASAEPWTLNAGLAAYPLEVADGATA